MATSKAKRTHNELGAVSPREDTRIRKDPDTDARGPRSMSDAERQNDDGNAMSPEQLRAMIRSEFLQEALPTVPKIPGWHLCWLSTTNSYDPIHKRMRLGYVPVKYDELPGFEQMRMTSGEFEGAISCNEMLLFKIPNEMFQAIMQEFHHNMPAEEEDALKRQLVDEGVKDSTGKKLGSITEDSDGYEELAASRPRAGIFAG